MRSSYCVAGAMTSTVTLATLPDSGRPSDLATSAVVNTVVAVTGIPGMFWYTALTIISKGSGYAPFSFNWVLAENGGLTLQYASTRGVFAVKPAGVRSGRPFAKQLLVSVRPVLTPPL